MEWNEWISRRRQQHGGKSNERELRSGLEEEKEKKVVSLEEAAEAFQNPHLKLSSTFWSSPLSLPLGSSVLVVCLRDEWGGIVGFSKFRNSIFNLFSSPKNSEKGGRGVTKIPNISTLSLLTQSSNSTLLLTNNEEWDLRWWKRSNLVDTTESTNEEMKYTRREKKLEFHQADKDSCEKESNSPKPKFQIDTQQLNGISL